MAAVRFEWDDRKSRLNRRKHGVSFEEAVTVFYDKHARLIDDPEHSESEHRYVLLGISAKLRLLIVCHSYHEAEDLVRIISARKATKREALNYRDR